MTVCVLDSSAALAWVLPAENHVASDALLDKIVEGGAVAPGLWRLEIGNVLLVAERRRRITLAERQQAVSALAELPIHIDPHTAAHAWAETLNLAAGHNLTIYDASYLELAIRLVLPLASLDQALCRAAAACGVDLYF